MGGYSAATVKKLADKEIEAKANDPVKKLKKGLEEEKSRESSSRKKRSSKNSGSKY